MLKGLLTTTSCRSGPVTTEVGSFAKRTAAFDRGVRGHRHAVSWPPLKPAASSLRRFPLAGPARAQLGSGLRVTFHHPDAIYCKPLPDAVVIIRVIRGARDVAALAEGGAFS
jgi:hypothetical protein